MNFAAWLNLKSRFNTMSLRERAMVASAVLALLVFLWDRALMNPLRQREQQLQQDLAATQQGLAALSATIQSRADENPLVLAMKQKQSLTESISAVDRELQSTSAGLIPPDRMLAALRDVLQHENGLRLVSMHNLPVASLVPTQPGAPLQGPYVHSLEFVVEGGYLDVLRYLEKVEALPWRFYWQVLELKTAEYPLNRIRIRLNTLSMDKEWLGV
ncbi:MAG TPA: type II secretion system protein GspM [Steroidobacteraceae bacterium]|nr:type II secretion system protein GspM [Steroidobacteraceae bacterium]